MLTINNTDELKNLISLYKINKTNKEAALKDMAVKGYYNESICLVNQHWDDHMT